MLACYESISSLVQDILFIARDKASVIRSPTWKMSNTRHLALEYKKHGVVRWGLSCLKLQSSFHAACSTSLTIATERAFVLLTAVCPFRCNTVNVSAGLPSSPEWVRVSQDFALGMSASHIKISATMTTLATLVHGHKD